MEYSHCIFCHHDRGLLYNADIKLSPTREHFYLVLTGQLIACNTCIFHIVDKQGANNV